MGDAPSGDAVTALQVLRRQRRRAQIVQQEFRATMEGVRKAAQKYSREQMVAGIYAIPEDTNKAGEKLWERTHALLEHEKGVLTQPYEVIVTNDLPYAVRRERASASVPRGRKGPGDIHYINPIRETHWRAELVETFRPILMDLLHETQLAILKRTAE